MIEQLKLIVSKYILFIAILLLSGCSDKPQETLRVGAVLWPGYEPLYLAKKLGYYEDQPIKIIDYLSNTDAILAFKNNHLDAGAFTLDEVLQILSDGIDIDVILIMDISNGGDVILANQDIASVKDLKGKSVAVESSAVGAYVLKRALELNNMELKDINIVSTIAMEQKSSFSDNTVVAAVSFDPYRTELIRAGKKEIFNSKLIPNEIVDVLVVRKSYLKEHPETLQHLVDSWFKALKYQSDNPVKSAEYSLVRFSTSSQEYIDSLKLLKFTSKDDNKMLLDSINSPFYKQQGKIVKILNELGLIDNTPSLKGHLNNSYIQ